MHPDTATFAFPSVAVLMATRNGAPYMREQIESIAAQRGVAPFLWVSDDGSDDATVSLAQALCARHGIPCRILPLLAPSGSAAKNFFRLIRDVDPSDTRYFALADQDDIWHPGKLISAIRALDGGADAASSDVTAFWPDGTRKPIVKSQPQRRFDHLFESAGPGCTFVFSAPLFQKLQYLARTHRQAFDTCALHDWAIYAVARALGYSWQILPEPTMLYRQHGGNVVGARKGLSASIKRLGLIRDGWVYGQVLAILDLVEICCPDAGIDAIRRAAMEPGLRNRIRLCFLAWHMRRRFADRCLTAVLFASGLFWPNRNTLQQQESTR